MSDKDALVRLLRSYFYARVGTQPQLEVAADAILTWLKEQPSGWLYEQGQYDARMDMEREGFRRLEPLDEQGLVDCIAKYVIPMDDTEGSLMLMGERGAALAIIAKYGTPPALEPLDDRETLMEFVEKRKPRNGAWSMIDVRALVLSLRRHFGTPPALEPLDYEAAVAICDHVYMEARRSLEPGEPGYVSYARAIVDALGTPPSTDVPIGGPGPKPALSAAEGAPDDVAAWLNDRANDAAAAGSPRAEVRALVDASKAWTAQGLLARTQPSVPQDILDRLSEVEATNRLLVKASPTGETPEVARLATAARTILHGARMEGGQPTGVSASEAVAELTVALAYYEASRAQGGDADA